MKNLLVLSPTEIEFEADNRLYSLEITQQCLTNAFGVDSTESECPFTGVFSHDYTPVIDLYWWNRVELSSDDFWAVVEANRDAWYDVTECSDRGQALLKRQARASFLRSIMENANKLRKKLGNLGAALTCAWTKVKILASGVVNFIKLADYEAKIHQSKRAEWRTVVAVARGFCLLTLISSRRQKNMDWTRKKHG